MKDSPQPDRFVRFPTGLAGTFVLVLITECLVLRVEHTLFLNVQAWQWYHVGKISRGKMPPSEIVFFGDSLFKGGIAPPVVEEGTGRHAFNLAVTGGQPSSSYFLLRRVVKRGRRPDVVVIENLPRLLELSPWFNQDHWPVLLDTRECIDLAWIARDADLFASVMLARLLPSFRVRREVRSNLMAALRGEDRSDHHCVPPNLVRNLRINKGSLIFPEKAVVPSIDATLDEHCSPRWTCHPAQVNYLRRFLSLAAAHEIPVFWVLPPMHPAFQTRCERTGFDARFTRFVRDMSAPFPNVTVVDGRRSHYAPRALMDMIHLSRPGAAVFSADLAAILRCAWSDPPAPSSPAPRWVSLPPYRPLVVPPVEDLEQSRLILRERLAKRR